MLRFTQLTPSWDSGWLTTESMLLTNLLYAAFLEEDKLMIRFKNPLS